MIIVIPKAISEYEKNIKRRLKGVLFDIVQEDNIRPWFVDDSEVISDSIEAIVSRMATIKFDSKPHYLKKTHEDMKKQTPEKLEFYVYNKKNINKIKRAVGDIQGIDYLPSKKLKKAIKKGRVL